MPDAGASGEHRIAGPRLIAIVGPFQSGKTSLLESLLARGGGASRQGSVREGTSVGDSSPEARAHAMSVEPNIAHVDYMGDRLTFFDCPGSVEFMHDMRHVAAGLRRRGGRVRGGRAQGAGAAGDPARTRGAARSRACCSSTRSISPAAACARRWRCCSRPRARRCCCARSRSGRTASPPASSISRWSAPSSIASRRRREVVEMPVGVALDEKQARYSMLERLADYDDELMEQLHQRHRAAARPRVRRSRARTARGPCRAAADGLGDRRPRRDAPAEGAAPRGARHRADARSGSASRRRARALAQVRAHHPHRPRRQTVARARAARRLRRRRDRHRFARRRGAHRRAGAADGRDLLEDLARRGGRHGRLPAAGERRDRRPLRRGQDRARRRGKRRPRRRRRSRSRSMSGTARTRSGSPPRSPSSPRRIPRSPIVHDPESGELKLFGQGEMHLRVTSRAARRPLRRRGRDEEAVRRLSRDDPRGGDGARAPQEAVGRPRAVRRRARRGRPARARRRFRVRREGARRHGAEAIFLVRRDGRAGRAGARAARLSRSSTSP